MKSEVQIKKRIRELSREQDKHLKKGDYVEAREACAEKKALEWVLSDN